MAGIKLHNITLRRRVKKGARWLDRNLPYWFNGTGEIDVDRLNMGDCSMCMLGQLESPLRRALRLNDPTKPEDLGHQGYQKVLRGLFPDSPTIGSGKPDQFAVLFGFELDHENDYEDESYHRLTELWQEEIFARRNGYAEAS